MEIFLDTIIGSKTNKKESHLWHLKVKVDIPSFVQSQNGFGMAQHANFQIFQISRRFKVLFDNTIQLGLYLSEAVPSERSGTKTITTISLPPTELCLRPAVILSTKLEAEILLLCCFRVIVLYF